MSTPQPSTIAALECRLERSASSPRGVFIMTRDEAQVMLEEIRRLRANQSHGLEMVATDMTRSLGFGMPGKTVLRSQAIVNGRRRQVCAEVDELVWGTCGPGFHERMMAELRHRLVEEIAAELDPPVVVQRGPSLFGGGVSSVPAPNPFITRPSRAGDSFGRP